MSCSLREIWKIGNIFLLTIFFVLTCGNICVGADYNNTQNNKFSFLNSIRDKFSFSGIVESRFGRQIKYDDFEDKKYAFPLVRTTLKYDLTPKEQGFVFAKKKSYIKFSLQWSLLYSDDSDVQRDEDFGLYEGYLVLNRGPVRLRIGKQIIRWGKTDQISPVDNLNSQDMRLFIIPSYEDRKIPNWMADVEFFKKNVRLEAVIIPFVEPNEVYFFDRNYSVFKQLKKSSAYYLDKYPMLPAQRIYLKNYVDSLETNKDIPDKTLENFQGGVRIGFSFENLDVAVSYLNNFDPNPYIKYFPVSGIRIKEDFSGENVLTQLPFLKIENKDVEATYIRRNIYGVEFEGGVGDFGIRGELAYFDKTVFLTESLTSIQRSNLWYVLGIDYTGEDDLYLNVQLSHSHIFNYTDPILYFKEDNVSILGELSKGFFAGDWKLGIKSSYFLSDFSYFINPYIVCKRIPNLDIELGSFVYGGDRDTLLGQYDPMDEIYIKLKYYF